MLIVGWKQHSKLSAYTVISLGGSKNQSLQNEMTFRQLPNSRFSQNLTTKHESVSPQNVSKGIFENLYFRGHLPQKSKNWTGSDKYTHGTHSRDIVHYTSLRAREFLRCGQRFCTTYGFGTTGRLSLPIFAFLPIFPTHNAKKVLFCDKPTSQGLHRRKVPVILCSSRRSKGLPFASEVFLQLVVRELETQNCPHIHLW